MFTWDWSHQLTFSPILLQITDDRPSIEACRVGGKRWDSSFWTHGYVGLWREVPVRHAILARNTVIHGEKQQSCVPDSRTRRAAHDDDRLWVPSRPQELGNHVSTGHQATNYDKFDWQSDTTTDRDSIDDYPIFRVSPWWDPNNEARRISMIERSNRETINSYSNLAINRSTMTKCGSSSSSRTPPQPRLQHGPTARPNLWDKSGLPL
jgi:hypothetical protein